MPLRKPALSLAVVGLLPLSVLSLQCTTTPIAANATATAEASLQPPTVITELDMPLLFTYGTWEKKVQTADGRLTVRGEGITPQGGGGANQTLNLSQGGELSPALKVRVGAGNRMKMLNLLLKDGNDQSATFRFPLPAASDTFLTITPQDGASLARPNATELKPGSKGFDLAKVVQWQLIGDWSGEPVDLEVDAIVLLPPDATVKAARAALEEQAKAEQERRLQEQEAMRAKYTAQSPLAPKVVAVTVAAPDILSLTIEAGKVIPSTLSLYQPRTGDEKVAREKQVILKRDGKEIGWLIGPERNQLVTYEKLEGDPLVEFLADKPENHTVDGAAPTAVYRKSKPTDWAQPGDQFAMRHQVYLKLPKPLTAGKTLSIQIKDLNVRNRTLSLVFDPAKVPSEGIHVHQVGYRPDDPVKRAFLSLWLGTGGACTYPENLGYQVVRDSDRKPVHSGRISRVLAADGAEELHRKENHSKTAVYRMDFSEVKTPGLYRVVVDGVGCSLPFEIGADVWKKAFLLQMRGLYNNRSGVALGPPYTDFVKPRDFHPADGLSVFQSRYSIMDGPGENPELAKQATAERVPEAWGGYHDAGDWNPRRATHLRVTMAQLELLEMFPRFFRPIKLGIPVTEKVPDILTEALFKIDCWRRLQKPDGGVPYGIETDGDPIAGEVSWLQSFTAYVYAPDPWSSYIYAQAAARAAKLLQPTAPEKAKLYRDTALKAMAWAEKDRARRASDGSWAKARWEVKDDRNLAALVLYDLTGEKKWWELFLEDTCLKEAEPNLFVWSKHVQRDAAFLLARTERTVDPALKAKAIAAIERQAQQALSYAAGNAFNLTTPDKGKPMFLGFFSTPDAIELARAHFLTGKADYLAGTVQATQFQAGCNPNNMTYTVGLGSNYPLHPLKLDARRTGQKTPVGLTIYGNCDYNGWRDNGFFTWPVQWHLSRVCTPSAWDWPLTEAYFDIFLYPAQTEYTVDAWDKNVYVWGYLAARP